MPKKIIRAVAVITCFSILTLSIPGSISAKNKAPKFSFDRIFSDAFLFISYILPIGPVNGIADDTSVSKSNDSIGTKIKITDGNEKPKPPAGDD